MNLYLSFNSRYVNPREISTLEISYSYISSELNNSFFSVQDSSESADTVIVFEIDLTSLYRSPTSSTKWFAVRSYLQDGILFRIETTHPETSNSSQTIQVSGNGVDIRTIRFSRFHDSHESADGPALLASKSMPKSNRSRNSFPVLVSRSVRRSTVACRHLMRPFRARCRCWTEPASKRASKPHWHCPPTCIRFPCSTANTTSMRIRRPATRSPSSGRRWPPAASSPVTFTCRASQKSRTHCRSDCISCSWSRIVANRCTTSTRASKQMEMRAIMLINRNRKLNGDRRFAGVWSIWIAPVCHWWS